MNVFLIPAMLYACWMDYRFHRVPNWLNLMIAATGLAMQAVLFGTAGVTTGLWGMAAGFASLIVLWLMKCMGAGDVKFMMAVGAWLGPMVTFQATITGGIVGGIIAMGLILKRRNWRHSLANAGVMLSQAGSLRTMFRNSDTVGTNICSDTVMPYAIPLTIGAMIVVLTDFTKWWGIL